MISCKDYVKIRKKKLKKDVDMQKIYKRAPHLCVIQIGNDEASNSYIKGKKKDCDEIGIKCSHIHIEETDDVSQEILKITIKALNDSDDVDGIILQLPIPDKYNVEELQKCISPEKDVDGFRPDSCFKPCTPKGIIDWLKYNKYEFTGKDAVVVGRSKIVGKPLVNMLIDEGATVTCCNSKTKCLRDYTLVADIVFSAIGKENYFDFSYFDPETEVIVDIGINRDKDNELCGDVDNLEFDEYLPYTYVTPVPGGVGLLTRCALMENVVEVFKNNWIN